ncbi:hypothetical protein LB507_003428, partial [Fusarium sp. FIESC RH6]
GLASLKEQGLDLQSRPEPLLFSANRLPKPSQTFRPDSKLSAVSNLVLTFINSSPFLTLPSPLINSPISPGWNQFIHTSTSNINIPSKTKTQTSLRIKCPSLPSMNSITLNRLRTQIKTPVTYSVARYVCHRTSPPAKEEKLNKETTDNDLLAHLVQVCNGHETTTYQPLAAITQHRLERLTR